jgi:hypothetical protein
MFVSLHVSSSLHGCIMHGQYPFGVRRNPLFSMSVLCKSHPPSCTTSCSIILVYHRFVLDFRHQTNTSFRAMPTYEPGIYINRLNVLLTHLRTRVMPEIIIITLLLLSLKLQHIINLKNLLANNWYWYVTSPSTLFVMVRLWLYSIVWCWVILNYYNKNILIKKTTESGY